MSLFLMGIKWNNIPILSKCKFLLRCCIVLHSLSDTAINVVGNTQFHPTISSENLTSERQDGPLSQYLGTTVTPFNHSYKIQTYSSTKHPLLNVGLHLEIVWCV